MTVQIFQGEDKTLVVSSNLDLTTATEIEFRVDTDVQIVRSLSNGDISGVTATQFSVEISGDDTETVKAGNYKYQVRATIGGKKRNGKFSPNKFEVLDSIFTTAGSGNDYN